MTSNDKTGDRLVASIRKTKAGAAAGGQGTQRAAQKPAAGRAAGKPRGSAGKAPAQDRQEAQGSRRDDYQCGRRVWPD